ncbi:MAG: chemotaxis protein CheX [Lentisphaeraceae bacterium]|nr:chemotaxis protein CheX [Lentisphaeraceae bacterium]
MEEIEFDVIKSFADSFCETVTSMTSLKVERFEAGQGKIDEVPVFQVLMGFHGGVSGYLGVRCSVACLLRFYERYLGEKSETLNEDVLDGIKELVGIIGGAAAAKVQDLKLQFGAVVTGLCSEQFSHIPCRPLVAAINYFVDECGVFSIEIHQRKLT